MALVCGSVAEVVGGWSSFALVWLGVLAFAGTIIGINQTRQNARRARTLDYLRRLDGHTPLSTQVVAFLMTGDSRAFMPGARVVGASEPSPAAMVRAFSELDIETQGRVFILLNFYEEMSCSYNHGLLDEDIAKKMLAPHIQTVWEEAEGFIRQWRAQLKAQSPEDNWDLEVANEMLIEWETLARYLKRNQDGE